jgi:hypothetical protein
VSTASRNCRFHQQRLQALRNNALTASESSGGGPWVIRPKRLRWLANITVGFKIAAFFRLVSSLKAFYTTTDSICGFEAMAGASPPFSFPLTARGPP